MISARDPWQEVRPHLCIRRPLLALAVALGLILLPLSGSALASARHARPAHASHRAGAVNLGPHVYVFNPSMPQSTIQSTVDAIAAQQASNQFGRQRYALLFEPGTYGSASDPLTFQVGYYTEVAGLGATPGAVTINGAIDVFNQCSSSGCDALDNFWRSLSNLTIHVTGQSGCRSGTDFWAVSQASPMRRVDITGGNLSLMDYCTAGPQFASGGFIADSAFSGGTVINGSQQQFLVRNSDLDGWTNGVWNQVFSGDVGAPPQSFSAGDPGPTPPYTTLPTSPVTEEAPFLYKTSSGHLRVFVPAVQHNTVGTSWDTGSTAGSSVSLRRFFVASPRTKTSAINSALARHRDLLLTPGVYDLRSPIHVVHPNTIVLGLGFPTLVPQTGKLAMRVGNAPGVKLSGLIFDAGPVRSPDLLQVGNGRGPRSGAADPTVIQDVFFRIGGAQAGRATDSAIINRSHTIIDDMWAWRADHGAGVGWNENTASTGLIVRGADVTAYGLFVEHYQKSEVIWTGARGTDIFFQNENPYDPPSQAAWMQSPHHDGYPAMRITRSGHGFQGYGMGSYSFFNQGIPIHNATAFEVPSSGVALHDLLTRFLNGSGGIDHVVNSTGAPVDQSSPGPSDVLSYP